MKYSLRSLRSCGFGYVGKLAYYKTIPYTTHFLLNDGSRWRRLFWRFFWQEYPAPPYRGEETINY